MDRFSWCDGLLGPDEQLIATQNGVRIYDGDEKTAFDHGKLSLSSHRLLWRDHKDQQCVMCVLLSQVIFCEEVAARWSSSAKITCHLSLVEGYRPPGPASTSKHNHVRFSFKEGGHAQFLSALNEALHKRAWDHPAPLPQVTAGPPHKSGGVGGKKIRTGIGGIEKTLAQKHHATNKDISLAFEDLSKLMEKAKDMVALSQKITSKMKEKQGDITEDETIRFKSYLLSLGIPDPVTRDTHGTGHTYLRELAKQIARMMQAPLQECGGIMTMSDVYCRVNRARGMELLSPDDLVSACRLLEVLALPVRLAVYESGVMVLQLSTHSDTALLPVTAAAVTQHGSLTAHELSRHSGLPVVLASERLLACERAGKLCRDECMAGLRFYPNLFLHPPQS